nr:inovirus-type Gp2 protein [Pseudomonas aeruginosa]
MSKSAWTGCPSAHGIPRLVHIPERAEYRIDRYIRTGDHDALPELLHRVSYLCKAATKSYGDRQRGFGTSRG